MSNRLRGSDARAAKTEAAHEAEVDRARALDERRNGNAPRLQLFDIVEPIDKKTVSEHLAVLSSFVGRTLTVAVERDGKRRRDVPVAIQQCRVCGDEVRSEVTADWQTTLAHAVRHDYAAHRCAAVDQQLHGCSIEELTQLHADAESEVVRASERVMAIEQALGLRSADGRR